MGRNEEILNFIKARGPVLPVDIGKLLGVNLLFASAHLSELTSKGLVKISSVKVGGSPVYYVPGQEVKLQNYVDRLHEKERRAYELLKKERLLKDSEQEAIVRFALRQIKDFAKPIEVAIGNEKQIFWRWYLLGKEEVERIIREKHLNKKPEVKPVEKEGEPEPQEEIKKEPEPQRTLKPEIKPTNDGFLQDVEKYFARKDITIAKFEVLKKKKQAWYIVGLPTPLGRIEFYAEAKQKKRITDGDLSEAMIRGRNHNLPMILFFSDGALSKSTKEKLGIELKGIYFVQIGNN